LYFSQNLQEIGKKIKSKNMRKIKDVGVKKSREHEKILDIFVSGTRRNDLLNDIVSRLTKKEKFYIVTPNPEIILESRRDKRLKSIILNADIRVNDGVGIAIAQYYLQLPTSSNQFLRLIQSLLQWPFTIGVFIFRKSTVLNSAPIIKGRDLFVDLLLIASRRKFRVYLLGARAGVADKLAANLKSKYRKLRIKASSGACLDKDGKPVNADENRKYIETLSDINKFAPHIIFVALGAPKQEKFISDNLSKLNVKCMMTVGGAFDSELQPSRIINFFARIHLEWLGRLIREPQRIGRIVRAVVIFPFWVFWQKVRDGV